MRTGNLIEGLCAAALIPSAALAQQTCQERQSSRVAGTVVGAGVGALAGSAIAGRGDRSEGAVIGGLAGAIVGNQVSKDSRSRADCARAYGYYDNNGMWHANAVAQREASGYFDRNGDWVEGAPMEATIVMVDGCRRSKTHQPPGTTTLAATGCQFPRKATTTRMGDG
jgi:hypothetical protein